MILIEKILGNVIANSELKSIYEKMKKEGKVETISIGRLESERVRMRKMSDKGTDIALTLPQGSHLHDGDVVSQNQNSMIVVRQAPENVAVVSLRANIPIDHLFQVALTIGHTIGNLHRPLRIDKNSAIFPIQTSSEVELFKKLLSTLRDQIDIKTENVVFEANLGSDVHEH
jgi:urease accessory protein